MHVHMVWIKWRSLLPAGQRRPASLTRRQAGGAHGCGQEVGNEALPLLRAKRFSGVASKSRGEQHLQTRGGDDRAGQMWRADMGHVPVQKANRRLVQRGKHQKDRSASPASQPHRCHLAWAHRGNAADGQAGALVRAEGRCFRARAARGLAAVGGAADKLVEQSGKSKAR